LTNVTTTNLKPYGAAHRACRNTTEREQLASVLKARWPEAVLQEYARLHFFKNGKDQPTATSYRRAIADIASGASYPRAWLKSFRKGGSKPLPPRREGLLQRGRGLGHGRVTDEEYAWPGHTEEYRTMIEQRCRDYFGIAPEEPVHVNAWAASHIAYCREQKAEAEVLRRAREAVALHLVPKSQKKSPKAPRRKPVPQYDISDWGTETLKPHFNYEFPGHSEAFREEVAALARKGKKPDAHVSPLSWKIACHKNYVLVEKPTQ
jgi:hypothetical protein